MFIREARELTKNTNKKSVKKRLVKNYIYECLVLNKYYIKVFIKNFRFFIIFLLDRIQRINWICWFYSQCLYTTNGDEPKIFIDKKIIIKYTF